MSTNFPSGLDTTTTLPTQSATTPLATNHVVAHTNIADSVIALETKVGVDSSAVTATIDYKLKSTSSIDPGHKHTATSVTLNVAQLADATITSVADGNVLTYQSSSSKWINSTTSAPDASTTVKGVSKLDTAPVSSVNPVAVGTNSALLTTSSGTATSASNKIIDQLGFQKGSEVYAADAGASDSYAITLSPVPAAYVTGMEIKFKANTANTGAATLNVNSLGAITIKKRFNSDLNTGDILASQIIQVVYDGTNFQMMSPQSLPFLGLVGSGATTYDLSTASGTQNIAHGLGVIPKQYRLAAVGANNSGIVSFALSLSGNSVSTGSTTDTPTNTFRVPFTVGNYQDGVVTSDATNIIITWIKNGSPTGTARLAWDALA